jgi:hypothetical protein
LSDAKESALEAGHVTPRRHDGEPDAETRLAQLKRELAAVRDAATRRARV